MFIVIILIVVNVLHILYFFFKCNKISINSLVIIFQNLDTKSLFRIKI